MTRVAKGFSKMLFAVALVVLSACDTKKPPTPDFSLAFNPASISLAAGATGNSTLVATLTGGFDIKQQATAVSVDGTIYGTDDAHIQVGALTNIDDTHAIFPFLVGSSVSAGSYDLTFKTTIGGLARSAKITINVGAAGNTVPNPTNLKPTVLSSTEIDLAWNAVPSATGYLVEEKVGTAFQTLGTVTNAGVQITSLIPNSPYTFRVKTVIGANSSSGVETSATTQAGNNPPPPGSIPPELVGIWKGIDVPVQYVNAATGAFTGLSGWYGQIKLRSDGHYEFEQYLEGLIGNCRVSFLTRRSGAATTNGTEIILTPGQALETSTNCDSSKNYSNKAISLPSTSYVWNISSKVTLFGYATPSLTFSPPDSHDFPLVFDRVDGAVLPSTAPRFPADAVLGNDPLSPALVATWSSPATAPLDFYNPSTGAFNPPSSSVSWLKLSADGHFELTGFNANVVPGSGCKKSAMVYERGLFTFTKATYGDYLVLQPEVNTLIGSLSNCGTDDGSQQRALPLEQQFFYVSLGRTVNNEEVFEIRCSGTPEERSEWQFLICPSSGSDFRALYSRR